MSVAVMNFQPGYFGKFPGYRDFVQRGLPPAFTDRWGRWLRSVMDAGNTRLGEEWLDVYLNSPVWRFAIRDPELGPGMWLGALMPSLDARQRYFPLSVVLCLEPQPPFQLMRKAETFLAALEVAMVATLQEPYPDTVEFAELFQALVESSATDCLRESGETAAGETLEQQALHGLDQFVAQSSEPVSVWHAANVASARERLAVFASLPDPMEFIGLQETTVSIEQATEDPMTGQGNDADVLQAEPEPAEPKAGQR